MSKLGEKLLPKGADHFTITSQSDKSAAEANPGAHRTASKSQSEIVRGLLAAGESEQTVNPMISVF